MGRTKKYVTNGDRLAARRQQSRGYRGRKIDIGDQREIWRQLALQTGCTSDADLAKLLIGQLTGVEVKAVVDAIQPMRSPVVTPHFRWVSLVSLMIVCSIRSSLICRIPFKTWF